MSVVLRSSRKLVHVSGTLETGGGDEFLTQPVHRDITPSGDSPVASI